MDAANQAPAAEVRPVEQACRLKKEEAAMENEALPLPVAQRNETISERDFDALCRAAAKTSSVVSRLRREPRYLPEREPVGTAR